MKSHAMEMHGHSPGVVQRSLIIGLTAFLTVVDLFATQAILPSLTKHYNVTPAAMGFAVNASTMGMAGSGPVGVLLSRIVRRPHATFLAPPPHPHPSTFPVVAPPSDRLAGSSPHPGVYLPP